MDQKSTKTRSKTNQNRSWSPLEPSWRCPSRHGGVQEASLREKLIFALTLERNHHFWARVVISFETSSKNQLFTRSAPRTSLKGVLDASMTAWTPPRRLWGVPRPILVDFWSIVGRCLIDFWSIFDRLLIDLWMMNDEWWMPNDQWWMLNDGWWMMNDDGWCIINDEWRMTNDDWWTMNDWVLHE